MKPLYLVGQDAPLSRLPKSFPQTIDESLSLGIDIGIGSCGTALVHDKLDGKPVIRGFESVPENIVFMGVRTFDVPEIQESRTAAKAAASAGHATQGQAHETGPLSFPKAGPSA
jgi:hypothetical protein